MKVAVIGGGLAGCAAAYILKKAGAEPVVFESSSTLASGASGNELGMYNPRFSAQRTPQSDFFSAAFSKALRVFRELGDSIDWHACGALHLVVDEKKAQRYPQTVENWGWEREHMRMVDAREASEIAGVPLDYEALYLPEAGVVSPRKLCGRYVEGVEVRLDKRPESLEVLRDNFDAVIVACGYNAGTYLDGLALGQVRGQVTQVRGHDLSSAVRCNLCYGGYFTPAFEDGVHVVGATFQRWLNHSDILEEDDRDNLNKLAAVVPGLVSGLEIVGQRASVRTTTKDHFPVVGRVDGLENVYVSCGHGSHGILSSLMGAQLLCDMICDAPRSLPRPTIEALSLSRFTQREQTSINRL